MRNEPDPSQRHVKSYATSVGETDTYKPKSRKEKEAICGEEVRRHWDRRAQRPDVQAVMSARHTLEENREATRKLQVEIFGFLEGLVDGKNVFELGVGIGRMTSELAERAKKVVGVDISPPMLERAREKLKKFRNVHLFLGKITDLGLPPKSFDLIFESIVLLHILNPQELQDTIHKMQELSDRIFMVEHTHEGRGFPISKYSILRKPEEYERLFRPYKLVKQKMHMCAGDTFTMMLFENPVAQ